MTFAVIRTGGKQYKVAANDVVKIEKVAGDAGDVVTFDQVLMVGEGGDVTIGAPLVEGALVVGHLLSTEKQRTVIILKKQRRQHYDRRNGHRQVLSSVRIGEILTGGKKPGLGPDEQLKARLAAKAQAAESGSGDAAKPARKAAAKKAAPRTDTAEETPAAAEATEAKAPAKKAAAKAPAKTAAKKTPAKKQASDAASKEPAAKKAAAKAPATTAAKKTAAKKAAPKADKE